MADPVKAWYCCIQDYGIEFRCRHIFFVCTIFLFFRMKLRVNCSSPLYFQCRHFPYFSFSIAWKQHFLQCNTSFNPWSVILPPILELFPLRFCLLKKVTFWTPKTNRLRHTFKELCPHWHSQEKIHKDIKSQTSTARSLLPNFLLTDGRVVLSIENVDDDVCVCNPIGCVVCLSVWPVWFYLHGQLRGGGLRTTGSTNCSSTQMCVG